jgi:hypothetical protein
MKLRDILILLGLVVLVLVLTIAEEYAERRREARLDGERQAELQTWQEEVRSAFDARWSNLSAELRTTLDSMAQEIIAEGVSRESLAAMVVEPNPPVTVAEDVLRDSTESAKPASEPPAPPAVTTDSLARAVAGAYEDGLAALPQDLSSYERRIATNEVASLVRARFGLTPARFDSLLLHASKSSEATP